MSETNSQFPGVFRGSTRLASQQDLLALKEHFERLLAGPINEVGENGYIPWKYTADGSLDIEYLFPELLSKFSESTGVLVKRDGVKFSENVTSINFQGKYITLDIDENGCLICNIDEPAVKVPNFNDANAFGSALVKIDSELVSDMIVPDTSELTSNAALYGDWEPGKKVRGINWNKSARYDNMQISTLGPVFASSLSTYFEVKVSDGNGTVLASFVSAPVKANTRPDDWLDASGLQNSQHVYIYISDMKEEPAGYSFKPRFEINLIRILGTTGGRFNVKIIHHNDQVSYEYISDDLLYNCGAVPIMSSSAIQLVGDDSALSADHIELNWCSGVKYVSRGTVYVRLNNIYNLNNMAAVDNPVKYDFGIANGDENELITEDYDLGLEKVATFKIKLKLNDGMINNENIGGKVVLKNAFGSSEEYTISVPVLLNSQRGLEQSDGLCETFANEMFRVMSTFETNANSIGDYSTFVPWNSSKSLLEADGGRGLMVIPGVGLKYPYGDWTQFVPAGSPNYAKNSFLVNEKYFARLFEGNSKVKFGGVFKFEGLTADEFEDPRLTVVISCDQGWSWLNLKATRNMDSAILKDDGTAFNAMGILTKVEEYDGGIYVHWAYPTGVHTSQPIFFKLGMKPTSPFCIKSISLLNTDKEEDW